MSKPTMEQRHYLQAMGDALVAYRADRSWRNAATLALAFRRAAMLTAGTVWQDPPAEDLAVMKEAEHRFTHRHLEDA